MKETDIPYDTKCAQFTLTVICGPSDSNYSNQSKAMRRQKYNKKRSRLP